MYKLKTFVRNIAAFNPRNPIARGLCLGLTCLGVVLSGTGIPTLFAEDTSPLKELPRAVLRHTPPLFEEWNFETNLDPDLLPGFSTHTLGHGHPGQWTVVTEENAPSRTHALLQSTPCPDPSCYQLLIRENLRMEYVDLSVGILSKFGTPTSAAGLVLGMQDIKNFYAVLVYPASNTVKSVAFFKWHTHPDQRTSDPSQKKNAVAFPPHPEKHDHEQRVSGNRV